MVSWKSYLILQTKLQLISNIEKNFPITSHIMETQEDNTNNLKASELSSFPQNDFTVRPTIAFKNGEGNKFTLDIDLFDILTEMEKQANKQLQFKQLTLDVFLTLNGRKVRDNI